MKETHLKEFLKDHSQEVAGEILGCTQGAVSQMVKAKRNIYICESEDGETSFYEKKFQEETMPLN